MREEERLKIKKKLGGNMKLKNIFKRFFKSERGASAVVALVTALLTTYSAYIFIFISAEDEAQNQRDIHLYNAYQMARSLDNIVASDCVVGGLYDDCVSNSVWHGMQKTMTDLKEDYRLNADFSGANTYEIYDRTASIALSNDTTYDETNSTVTLFIDTKGNHLAIADMITDLSSGEDSNATEDAIVDIAYLVNLAGTANAAAEDNLPYAEGEPFYYLIMNDTSGHFTHDSTVPFNSYTDDYGNSFLASVFNSYSSVSVIILPGEDTQAMATATSISPAYLNPPE